MGRQPCCSKVGLNRGAWTAMEDRALVSYIKTHGEGKWRSLPQKAGLKRCGKSCRLRWLNYLRPGIKRGNISDDEEDLIIRLHKLLGNRWSLIAGRLPGRTDNEIKNYWNTNLGRRVNGNPNYNPSTAKSKDKCPLAVDAAATGEEEEPKVVRTKAVRCTRPFIAFADHMANSNSPVLQKESVSSSKCEAAGDNCVDFSNEQITSETMQEGKEINRSSAAREEHNDDGGMLINSSSGDMLTFEELQQDLELDFESMASFLDSKDWLQI